MTPSGTEIYRDDDCPSPPSLTAPRLSGADSARAAKRHKTNAMNASSCLYEDRALLTDVTNKSKKQVEQTKTSANNVLNIQQDAAKGNMGDKADSNDDISDDCKDDAIWLEFDGMDMESVLKELDEDQSLSPLPRETRETRETSALPAFVGFQTAGSKKTLATSANANKRARDLLADSLDPLLLLPLHPSSPATTPSNRHTNAVAATTLAADAPSTQEKRTNPCQFEKYIHDFGGFHTAGHKHKPIVVSDAAKLRAMSLFTANADGALTQTQPPSTTQRSSQPHAPMQASGEQPSVINESSSLLLSTQQLLAEATHADASNSERSSYIQINSQVSAIESTSLLLSTQQLLSAAALDGSNEKSRQQELIFANKSTHSHSDLPTVPEASSSLSTTPSSQSCGPQAAASPTRASAPFVLSQQPPGLQIKTTRPQHPIPTRAPRKMRRAIKPFKSPAVNIDLARAGLEKRGRSQFSVRVKGPSVFNLQSTTCRQPLSSLGKPQILTEKQLLAMNIPIDAIQMGTIQQARDYSFVTDSWNVDSAYDAMIDGGALASLLSRQWVANHYGMIVWRLARRIRQFPQHYEDGQWTWSPAHVLNQLLYRYEREINQGHRSVLKRIIEQDDSPMRSMVLMVTAIAPAPTEATGKSCRLQLTDGWYQITAYLDARLERMVEQLRIRVGQKLSISGAQLSGGASAMTPLEALRMSKDSIDMTAVSLQLSANSVLTCPWHTKLGNQRQSARHVRRIDSNVYDDGGVVTMLDVVICKKYPMMYSETMDNGSTKIRSAKEEELIRFSVAELRSDNSQERNVSGYFRLRVCDVTTTTGRMATLLVSQASEFIHTTLKEGQAYRISHIIPYEPKVRHHPGLCLRTTRMTHWEPRTPLPDTVYPMRTITPCDKIKTLTDTDNDMVVHVLFTYDAVCTRRSSDISVWQQRLLVTDASTAICQVSIYSFSRPLLIHAGQILCLSNVRFIMHDIKYNITLIKTTDESDVTTKSSIPLFTQAMADLKNWADSTADLALVQQRLEGIVHFSGDD